ncbi:hypothetical protein SDC9_163821 [bioreactor metagenome]|uniref:Uncharacterized protein n=1 Tax=bioreactor metagenome TaxID=1076179 RepID=A0A645FPX2_9ZZZZ
MRGIFKGAGQVIAYSVAQADVPLKSDGQQELRNNSPQVGHQIPGVEVEHIPCVRERAVVLELVAFVIKQRDRGHADAGDYNHGIRCVRDRLHKRGFRACGRRFRRRCRGASYGKYRK